MKTTPPPVKISDHPEPHLMQWSELEMRWIEARDAQWMERITALESDRKMLREAIQKQLDPAWECNSDHPALHQALENTK